DEQVDYPVGPDPTIAHVLFELFSGIHAEPLPEIRNLRSASFIDWTATTNFDDSLWKEGPAPFGDKPARTAWSTPELWLRRRFEGSLNDKAEVLYLRLKVDNTAEVFLNGQRLISQNIEFKYVLIALDAVSPSLVVPGTNTLAVHCRNDGGPGFIDLGLFAGGEGWKTVLAAKAADDPWLKLAGAYLALGEHDKAMAEFKRSVELAAGDAARASLAREAAALGDVFAQLPDRFPDDKALRLGQTKYLAAERVKENQYQAAIELLTGALANFPDDVELLNMRADAQMKLRHWAAAIDDQSRVIERSTDEGQRRAAELARAEAQLRLGQTAEAAELFTAQMFLTSSWGAARDAVAAQLIAGNLPAARFAAARLFQAIPADSKDANWCNVLVSDFIALPGMITPANAARLTSAAEAAGGEWTSPFKAAIHYRFGNLNEAAPLVSDTTGQPQFLCLAAMLLYDKGETSQARQYLQRADDWFRKERDRDRDPDAMIPGSQGWQDWALRLAVWREATNKLAGARLAELNAKIDRVDLYIVAAHYGAGEVQRDVTELFRTQLADARRVRSPSSNNIAFSISAYNVAFGGDPAQGQVKQLKVEYLLNGQPGEATFNENGDLAFPKPDAAIKDEPDTRALLLERAGLLSAIGLNEEALADFSKVPQPTTSSSDYAGLRGRILAGLNRGDEALVDLNQAVESQSTDPLVYAARAGILRKQGAVEQARSDLEMSLALEPTAPAAEIMADLLLVDTTRWTVLTPIEMKSQAGATLTLEPDGSVLAGGTNPPTDRYELRASVTSQPIAALKLEALVDPSLPSYGPGRSGDFLVSEIEAYQRSLGKEWQRIDWDGAVASFEQIDNPAPNAVDHQFGPSGWSIWAPDGGGIGLNQSLVARLREPIAAGETELRFVIHQNLDNPDLPGNNLGRFRLAVTDDATAFDRERRRFAALKLTDPWRKLAAAFHLRGDQSAVDRLVAHHPDASAGVGRLHTLNHDWPRALVEYDRAMTPETKDAELFAARATIHEKLEHWEPAAADWGAADLHAADKKARYGDPSFPALEHRAQIYGRLGQYDKQVADFDELLKPERLGDNHWIYFYRAGAG
ncbi:MAG TPA: hypothetical protein VMV69_08510, partial [Pirellulales bacterium]|nr:hypothetical protein [Pirellulales bacterium]